MFDQPEFRSYIYSTDRVQSLLMQIRDICNNILTNIYALGNDMDINVINSLIYSPNDVVYIYCKYDYTAHLLFQNLIELLLNKNDIGLKSITKDIVLDIYIIELNFVNQSNIDLNKLENTKFLSIKNNLEI